MNEKKYSGPKQLFAICKVFENFAKPVKSVCACCICCLTVHHKLCRKQNQLDFNEPVNKGPRILQQSSFKESGSRQRGPRILRQSSFKESGSRQRPPGILRAPSFKGTAEIKKNEEQLKSNPKAVQMLGEVAALPLKATKVLGPPAKAEKFFGPGRSAELIAKQHEAEERERIALELELRKEAEEVLRMDSPKPGAGVYKPPPTKALHLLSDNELGREVRKIAANRAPTGEFLVKVKGQTTDASTPCGVFNCLDDDPTILSDEPSEHGDTILKQKKDETIKNKPKVVQTLGEVPVVNPKAAKVLGPHSKSEKLLGPGRSAVLIAKQHECEELERIATELELRKEAEEVLRMGPPRPGAGVYKPPPSKALHLLSDDELGREVRKMSTTRAPTGEKLFNVTALSPDMLATTTEEKDDILSGATEKVLGETALAPPKAAEFLGLDTSAGLIAKQLESETEEVLRMSLPTAGVENFQQLPSKALQLLSDEELYNELRRREAAKLHLLSDEELYAEIRGRESVKKLVEVTAGIGKENSKPTNLYPAHHDALTTWEQLILQHPEGRKFVLSQLKILHKTKTKMKKKKKTSSITPEDDSMKGSDKNNSTKMKEQDKQKSQHQICTSLNKVGIDTSMKDKKDSTKMEEQDSKKSQQHNCTSLNKVGIDTSLKESSQRQPEAICHPSVLYLCAETPQKQQDEQLFICRAPNFLILKSPTMTAQHLMPLRTRKDLELQRNKKEHRKKKKKKYTRCGNRAVSPAVSKPPEHYVAQAELTCEEKPSQRQSPIIFEA